VGALLLNRTEGTSPSNTGVLLVGQQLLNDNAFFMGDIQQFLILPSPAPAYEVCSKYMPDCEFPLPDFSEPVDGETQTYPNGVPTYDQYNRTVSFRTRPELRTEYE
jgi:hypothetical protein